MHDTIIPLASLGLLSLFMAVGVRVARIQRERLKARVPVTTRPPGRPRTGIPRRPR